MLFELRHFVIAACAMLVMATGLPSAVAASDLAPAVGAIEAPADIPPDPVAADDISGVQGEHAGGDAALVPAESSARPSGGRARGWAAVGPGDPPPGRDAAALDRPPRRA